MPKEPAKPPAKPNRQTVKIRRSDYVEPTKSELQEMLRKAVENTK
jgi:hypothetical protein